VQALKAVGAFWNPGYYDPGRRTLTTKLYYRNSRQLRAHLNALAWLALATGRSLIVPNLLGDESRYKSDLRHMNLTEAGHVLWPGWRVLKMMDDHFPLTVVEPGKNWDLGGWFTAESVLLFAPAHYCFEHLNILCSHAGYYWRLKQHYVLTDSEIPGKHRIYSYVQSRHVVTLGSCSILLDCDFFCYILFYFTSCRFAAPFILSTFHTSALNILKTLRKHHDQPRVVLNVMSRQHITSPYMQQYIEDTLRHSASDSVGLFSNYSFESAYSPALVPANVPVPGGLLYKGQSIRVEDSVRACSKIFNAKRGNRSCFDKCK
jgi:hypothetical protein